MVPAASKASSEWVTSSVTYSTPPDTLGPTSELAGKVHSGWQTTGVPVQFVTPAASNAYVAPAPVVPDALTNTVLPATSGWEAIVIAPGSWADQSGWQTTGDPVHPVEPKASAAYTVEPEVTNSLPPAAVTALRPFWSSRGSATRTPAPTSTRWPR